MFFKEPRGVIWNPVVRASFFNDFFTINSKYHVFDMIFFSIHTNFFMRIQWNGSQYFIFGYMARQGKVLIFPKACFLEIKEYALNTSLKQRVFSIEIVKIDLGMFLLYFLNYCCHIIYSFVYDLYEFYFLLFFNRPYPNLFLTSFKHYMISI